MRITPEEVDKIAVLARLNPDAEQSARYAGQMNDILGYMQQLEELDTKGVEPLYTPFEQETVFREDKPDSEFSREDILKNAPESDGQYFIVPRIV